MTTIVAPGRIAIEVQARGSTDAVDRAKQVARIEGHRIRTLASCRPLGGGGQELQGWRVELAVRP